MKISTARILRHFVTCAALAVSACATSPYGNFTDAPEDVQKTIALDAVAQMTRAFPPAKTKLIFQQDASDHFGQAFLDGLRTSGYAVEKGAKEDDAAGDKQPAGAHIAAYTFDDVGDILRLTIHVGQRGITKAYFKKDDGSYAAAGYWVFKE